MKIIFCFTLKTNRIRLRLKLYTTMMSAKNCFRIPIQIIDICKLLMIFKYRTKNFKKKMDDNERRT